MLRLATYAGVFLTAASTLMLEILLTRITSVIAWYHLAFFVISLGMLGMTAGAVLVFAMPRVFDDRQIHARLFHCALGFSLTTPLSIWLLLLKPVLLIGGWEGFSSMLRAGLTVALPFVFAGTALALALTRLGLRSGIVYATDLFGAASGCVLVIPLLDRLDAPSASLAAASLGALAAAAFVQRGWFRRGLALSVAAALVGLAIANVTASTPFLRPKWVKGRAESYDRFAYVAWNTHSRVTLDRPSKTRPMLWAAGRNLPAAMAAPVDQQWLLIDGEAGTMIPHLGDTLAEHAYLDWDITAFAHRLRPTGAAAVIGVGGGRDVLEAVRAGHDVVVGVEINPLIADLHRVVRAGYSGLLRLPGVELVTDEARSLMARDRRQYSVVTMSLIDTWASTGAGAYALSENGLYTREAWNIFINRLAPDGIFTVSRWYLDRSPGETMRMLGLAMETLWARGIANPRQHVALLQCGRVASLLVTPTPFATATLDSMEAEAKTLGFDILLSPRKQPGLLPIRQIADVKNSGELHAFARQYPLDLSPPTDARPFFFSMLRAKDWFLSRHEIDQMDLSQLGNLQATQTLVYATLVSLLLTVLIVFFPMLARRRDFPLLPRRDVWASCGYFASIGLGFMFVEMGMLSRLSVFLGRPTLALAVLLCGLILFTGAGSMLSTLVNLDRRWSAIGYPLVPAGLVILAILFLPSLTTTFQSSGTLTRIAVSVALLAPTGIGLGLGFPLGLRLVTRLESRVLGTPERDGQARLGPWLWGVNGACGVCASGVGLGISMCFGVEWTLASGVTCYAILPLITRRLSHAGEKA